MGVHGLWTILSPIQEHVPLRSLGGKKLAVDLSGWVCGDMSVNQRAQTGCKLYLRNLVFRLIALLREAILPIAVTDGTAPVIKALAMQERLQFSRLNNFNKQRRAVSLKRSQFSQISSQCAQLLRALGVPCIASPGEAEAMCAFLNMENLVDGCITNDSDAFLYGATVVYRHFSLKSRDPSVEAYFSEHVKTRIGLCRQSLVLLSLLLGCDYWPSGVPAVGLASTGRILAQADIGEALKRLSKGCDTSFHSKADADEIWGSSIWRKIVKGLDGCPVTQIVNEFLQPWQERGWQMPSSKSLIWTRPNLYGLSVLRTPNRLPQSCNHFGDDIWSGQLMAPGSSSDKNLIISLKRFFTNSGYRFPVPAVEFRSAFPQLADTFNVDSFLSLTDKMATLSIDGQKKNAKRPTKESKVKKAAVVKNDVAQWDPCLQSSGEGETSGVTIQALSPWNSPLKKPITGKIIPPVEEVFTPSSVKPLKTPSPPINFISVRLSTQFERRLTIRSSLFDAETPPQSPFSLEFRHFKTPARLLDRLSQP
ncbi:hypothetical protein Aperf_G00000074541 [Anoplocephala perfoliata]